MFEGGWECLHSDRTRPSSSSSLCNVTSHPAIMRLFRERERKMVELKAAKGGGKLIDPGTLSCTTWVDLGMNGRAYHLNG